MKNNEGSMKIQVPGCMALTVPERRWFVVRLRSAYNLSTKGGLTDQVFEELRAAGYDVYLPRRRYDRHNRRLRVMAEWSEPLMPGYLFVAHPRAGRQVDDWTEVKAIDGVLGPLGSDNGPLHVPAAVIERIMQAEFASAYDETKAAKSVRGDTARRALEQRFKAGATVQVKDGPFATFIATVESLSQQERVTALVDIFGRLVPVDFVPRQLEEVNPTGPKRKAA